MPLISGEHHIPEGKGGGGNQIINNNNEKSAQHPQATITMVTPLKKLTMVYPPSSVFLMTSEPSFGMMYSTSHHFKSSIDHFSV